MGSAPGRPNTAFAAESRAADAQEIPCARGKMPHARMQASNSPTPMACIVLQETPKN